MAIVRDFIFETDPDLGVTGLRPTWLVEASATPSIAHDILEHRLKESGSAVTSEFQAIGALLALRIEHGAFFTGQPPAQQLANVIFEMLLELGNGKVLDPAPASRPLGQVDSWAEDLIQTAIPVALDMALRQATADDFSANGLHELTELQHHRCNDIAAWLRRGYRHSRRRFKHSDRYTIANRLFKDIDRASEAFVTEECLQDGDEVRVCINLRQGTINFRVNGQAFNG